MKNLKIYKNNLVNNKILLRKINNFYSFVIIPVSVGSVIYNYSGDLKASLIGTSYAFGYQTLRRFRKSVLHNK